MQGPSPSVPKRRLKFFERHLPWLVLGLVLGCGQITWVLAAAAGWLERLDPLWWGRNVRGYTLTGLALGVLAILLSIGVFYYSVRKRSLQETSPLKGTMTAWLWAHVYLGLLALLAAALHGGYGLISLSFSTGKLVFWAFAFLVLSGMAWRIVYRYVPPLARAAVRNYSREDAEEQAFIQEVEIEKLAAGGSDLFRSLVRRILDNKTLSGEEESLSAEEQAAFAEIRRLNGSRNRAKERMRRQARFHRILQGWRSLHVPLAILFVGLFVVHLAAAFDLPGRIFPAALGGYSSAEDCAQCHAEIVAEWEQSMHAYSLTSPVTIAQTNQVVADTLSGQPAPDPLLFCTNCHGPVGAALTGRPGLPLEAIAGMSDEHINEGVGCTACHQYQGAPVPGDGGLSTGFQAELRPGRLYFGPIEDPVGNAYHRSAASPLFTDNPDALCQSCHDLNYDLNGDGRIEVGVDLVLQTTYSEYEAYRANGGAHSCLDCHMPERPGAQRAAEAAAIPWRQDFRAPDRILRSHTFIGVDFPLDRIGHGDPQAAARAALLQRAATLSISDLSGGAGSVFFAVTVSNTGAGHRLPTGKGYGGQMWLEVVVTDSAGNILFASGVLGGPGDDLCDSETMADAMAGYVQGCPNGPDPQLVNFQQKLLDEIDILRQEDGRAVRNEAGEYIIVQPETGGETWLQHLTSASIPRIRPSDGRAVPRLEPGETRSFVFDVPVGRDFEGELVVRVRLLYRNLAPYFLRALADGQPEDEYPKIAPLIFNQPVIEMKVVEQRQSSTAP